MNIENLKQDILARFILVAVIAFACGLVAGVRMTTNNAETIQEARTTD